VYCTWDGLLVDAMNGRNATDDPRGLGGTHAGISFKDSYRVLSRMVPIVEESVGVKKYE
jgi:hypothetical protein